MGFEAAGLRVQGVRFPDPEHWERGFKLAFAGLDWGFCLSVEVGCREVLRVSGSRAIGVSEYVK